MKLIVGLGNPGRKYDQTRHNVGFEVLALLSRKVGIASPRTQFQGEIVEARLGDHKTLLVAPQTFMNLSGQCVRQVVDFYQVAADDVLVICDDLNLPLGKLRVRGKGSAGGQKGLADVIRHLGTDAVPRLRIGIGQTPPSWDAADYVLSRFSTAERETIDLALVLAADAAALWATQGLAPCMNQFNPA